MKKLLYSAPLALLLVASVFAFCGVYSLRADGGSVDYIGNQASFNDNRTTIKFSAYMSPESVGNGQGSLQITAYTTAGKRVVLNLGLKELKVVNQSGSSTIVESSKVSGTYWAGWLPQRVVLDKATYTVDLETGLVNVVGEGVVGFSVSGLRL